MTHISLLSSMFALATAVSLAGIQPTAYCVGDDDPMTAPATVPDGSPTSPPAAPKAKRPPRNAGDTDGVLSGPKVPADASKGDSSFGPPDGKKGQRQQMQGGGMMEAKLFMESIKSVMPMLSDDQRLKVDAIRESFQKEMSAWRETNGEKLKAMEEKMGGGRGGKGAKGGKPGDGPDGAAGGPPPSRGQDGAQGGQPGGGAGGKPDKAAMEEMQKIRSTMPNFETARDQIMAILTPDQQAEVKANVANGRKEMGKRGGPGGKGGPGGPGGPGQKSPPPAEPPTGDYKFPK